jgi:ATP-binding cassette subfamily F protein 3
VEAAVPATPAKAVPAKVVEAAAPIAEATDGESKGKRLNPIKLRQMMERQEAIEDEITRLEVEIADYEQALSNFLSAAQSIETATQLQARREDLTKLMAEWEEISETIEAQK